MSASSLASGSMAELITPGALDHRKKRALYRAIHRGTKELDWLVGRYFEARLPETSERGMDLVERFLTVPDPELHAWIMTPEQFDQGEFSEIVDDLRAFHKMTD